MTISLLVSAVALFACQSGPGQDSTAIATVDGTPITRDDYDEYRLVFMDPDGRIQASPVQIFNSLVNQALAHNEAVRRGLRVDPDGVEARVVELVQVPGIRSQIDRTGGADALRRRVLAFLEMKAVREAVIADARTRDSPSGFIPTSQHLQVEEDAAWRKWLDAQLECADIRVTDESLGVTSSTPAPTCAE